MDALLKEIKRKQNKHQSEVDKELQDAIDDMHRFYTSKHYLKQHGGWPNFLLRDKKECEALHREVKGIYQGRVK